MAGLNRAWLMERLRNGGPLLAVMLFILLMGFALGLAAPQAVDAQTLERTRGAIGGYIQALPEAGVSPSAECWRAFALNGGCIAAMWLCGISLLGLPLSAAILFLKGLSLGYAMSFLLDYQGPSGFVVIFLSMLPQNLLLAPTFIVAAATAAAFSLSLFRGRPMLGRALGVYGLRFTVLLAAAALAAFVQGYLCPLLLKLFFVII